MQECIGLVGGSSGDSLTDELHSKGYSVALVGGKTNDPGMNSADFVLVEDLSQHKLIINYFLEHKVKFIVIGTGHSKAIELARELEQEGFITSIDYSKSMLAKDKVEFKNLLMQLGIKTPKYISFDRNYGINEIVTEVGVPCVVKSATDAVQPQKSNGIEELKDAINVVIKTGTEVLVEQYVEGNDCTVAVVSDGKFSRSLGVTYYSKAKEYKLKGFENAYSVKLSKVEEDKLCDIAKKIVDGLDFIGVVRIDFIVDKEIYVLELNSIIVTGYNGSAYPFFKEQGIDIAKVQIENALKIYNNKKLELT